MSREINERLTCNIKSWGIHSITVARKNDISSLTLKTEGESFSEKLTTRLISFLRLSDSENSSLNFTVEKKERSVFLEGNIDSAILILSDFHAFDKSIIDQINDEDEEEIKKAIEESKNFEIPDAYNISVDKYNIIRQSKTQCNDEFFKEKIDNTNDNTVQKEKIEMITNILLTQLGIPENVVDDSFLEAVKKISEYMPSNGNILKNF